MTQPSRSHFEVLIVGAGHGGAQAAIALRQNGFSGTLALIGEEAEYPYERPPLSKEYFSGQKDFDRIRIRRPQFWADRDVAMLLGEQVIVVDPTRRVVQTLAGGEYGYDKLIWATGGIPRMLQVPGSHLPGVQGVRTKADADLLKMAAEKARQIVVIGGGYIGLEAAAVLSNSGKRVILLEALDRVLARVAGRQLSNFFENEHRAHGLDIRLKVSVEAIEGRERVTGVRLVGGEVIQADLVVVGIGIIPSVEPLKAAGASGENGVDVDRYCRTSLENIFAVGDCACHENDFAGGTKIRLESVQNATDQANIAAKTICGLAEPYAAVPWFWSNQYDLKLQTVGLSAGHDQAVLRGRLTSGTFSVIYLKEGRVVAIDCVNAVKDYVQGRELVKARARASPDALGDTSASLKSFLPPS